MTMEMNLTTKQMMKTHPTVVKRKQRLKQALNNKNPKETAILVKRKPKATATLSTLILKFKEEQKLLVNIAKVQVSLRLRS